jgi:hypothetical protein
MRARNLILLIFFLITAFAILQVLFLGSASKTSFHNTESSPIDLKDLLDKPGKYLPEGLDRETYYSSFTVVSSQRFEIPTHPKLFYYVRIRDGFGNLAGFCSMEDLSHLIGQKQIFRIEVRRGSAHEFPRGSVWDPYFINLLNYEKIGRNEALYVYIFKG